MIYLVAVKFRGNVGMFEFYCIRDRDNFIKDIEGVFEYAITEIKREH